MQLADRPGIDRWICLALAVATLAVYIQVASHQFLNYDDPDYVTDNPHVRAGLGGSRLAVRGSPDGSPSQVDRQSAAPHVKWGRNGDAPGLCIRNPPAPPDGRAGARPRRALRPRRGARRTSVRRPLRGQRLAAAGGQRRSAGQGPLRTRDARRAHRRRRGGDRGGHAARPVPASTTAPGFRRPATGPRRCYAVSVAGVLPSTCLTWFQAEQACRLSGKRLITNQEWQAAAAGTPDPDDADDGTTTCATQLRLRRRHRRAQRLRVVLGRARHGRQRLGVGGRLGRPGTELHQPAGRIRRRHRLPRRQRRRTTDAGPRAAARRTVKRPGVVARDIFPVSPSLPGALIRGGNFAAGARNGVFAIYGGAPPVNTSRSTGFRCAR